MRIEQVIKDYTPFLLKTTYLIIRDRAKVEAIVEQTYIKFKVENSEIVKPSIIKSKLLENLVKCLSEYYKSWNYQKHFVKRLFDNGEQYIHPGYHDDLSYAILRLPLKLREIAALYFYAGRTTAEISRLLGVSQGTVQQRLLKATKLIDKPIFEEEVGKQTAPIDAYLTEWDERAKFVEQKLIELVEGIEEAPTKKKHKKLIISIAVIVAAVVGILISEFFVKNDTQTIEEQQQIGKLEQTNVQNTFEIFPGAIQKGDVLIPPDIAFEIAKYYSYYLDPSFPSLSNSELQGRNMLYNYYFTLYNLEQTNYQFDLERIKFYHERAALIHDIKKGNPDYKSFIHILNDQYNITEQDIIDYYLVPQELSVYFSGLNTEYEPSELYELSDAFYKMAEYDPEKYYQVIDTEQKILESKYELLTDLSKLPFDIDTNRYNFALDEEGQIIMLNPDTYPDFMITNEGVVDIYDLRYDYIYDVNRLGLPDFIIYLQENYEETKNEAVLKYIEFNKIVLRSIDLELN